MEQLQNLKAEGRIEEARQHGLLQLAERPQDAKLHYEVAGLHDNLGREAQAIPLYQRAIALGLTGDALRGAWLGLGSSLSHHKAVPGGAGGLRAGSGLLPECQ
ncbi:MULTISPECIES: tetratricopeptide repeat protein [Aeromonas]|uniref:tetratricopeptide repeat protein n=1 Tax=Aeromonas TaxID=642 RepID=UPI0021166671|nr:MULTISPECIES: tetratricopeptide repeat protein [Aeromonas]UUI61870.1 tetratricopeptide repeat protein [Aeromonas salmonicida]